MGFLQAIRQIGEYFESQDSGGELSDIRNLLQLPMDLPGDNTPPERKPQAIQVVLDVEDYRAEQLNVRGIKDIRLSEYPGVLEENTIFDKLLYRDPTGANYSWSYTPIYRLGKGMGNDALAELLGDQSISWREKENSKSRFYKIHKGVIKGFEESGCFIAGSADRIMKALEERVVTLAGKWDDKRRSYIIIFGPQDVDGRFLYPGEVPAFIAHFRSKIGGKEASKNDEKGEYICPLCGENTTDLVTLDKVFKFSTFDKISFLPGHSKNNTEKVFPVCKRCFSLLMRGKTELENKMTANIGIPKMQILVIPEIIGEKGLLKKVIRPSENYLTSGVSEEEYIFERIIKRDSSFVYHFLFIEPNNAQEILHRLIEDVPPSQFRKLKRIWESTQQRHYVNAQTGSSSNETETTSQEIALDSILRRITAMILSLAGKADIDKMVMRDTALNVIASLFSNETISVPQLKQAATVRLSGLFADEEWLNDKKYSGGFKLEQLQILFDFLYAANRQITNEEVN